MRILSARCCRMVLGILHIGSYSIKRDDPDDVEDEEEEDEEEGDFLEEEGDFLEEDDTVNDGCLLVTVVPLVLVLLPILLPTLLALVLLFTLDCSLASGAQL